MKMYSGGGTFEHDDVVECGIGTSISAAMGV